ncbi:MAG: hypothetical protein ACK5TH_09710 [Prosthecobacter sp.]
MHKFLPAFSFLAVLALGSCDPAPRWISGNYEVYAIDDSQLLKFGVDIGGGTLALVRPKVVGIGEDERWIVVERHLDGDQTRPEFYYLEKLDVIDQRNGKDVAHGPFPQAEMTQKRVELKLPPISERFD